MNIIPMRDLKDTVAIECLCTEFKAPVFVTKNGYGKLVVMDIETFERLLGQTYEAKTINEGLTDVESGSVVEGTTALSDIRKKCGLLDIPIYP